MQCVKVADVGHGLCVGIRTSCDEFLTVIDCGSLNSLTTPFKGLLRVLKKGQILESFILSHYHWDHYNGLIYMAKNGITFGDIAYHGSCFVYFPAVPDIESPEGKPSLPGSDIALALASLNATLTIYKYSFIYQHKYFVPVDFLGIMQKVVNQEFKFKPLSQGDIIEIRNDYLTILWPPKTVKNDENIYKDVKSALESYKKALEVDPLLKNVDEFFRKSKIVNYLTPSSPEQSDRNVQLFYSSEELKKIRFELSGKETDETELKPSFIKDVQKSIPKATRDADKKMREVTNRLSLAFYKDDELLFMGDLGSSNGSSLDIQEVVNKLAQGNRTRFDVLITPHHGTHWDESMRKLKIGVAVSSNGLNNLKSLKSQYKEISEFHLSTAEVSDICLFGGLPCRRRCICCRWCL